MHLKVLLLRKINFIKENFSLFFGIQDDTGISLVIVMDDRYSNVSNSSWCPCRCICCDTPCYGYCFFPISRTHGNFLFIFSIKLHIGLVLIISNIGMAFGWNFIRLIIWYRISLSIARIVVLLPIIVRWLIIIFLHLIMIWIIKLICFLSLIWKMAVLLSCDMMMILIFTLFVKLILLYILIKLINKFGLLTIFSIIFFDYLFIIFLEFIVTYHK